MISKERAIITLAGIVALIIAFLAMCHYADADDYAANIIVSATVNQQANLKYCTDNPDAKECQSIMVTKDAGPVAPLDSRDDEEPRADWRAIQVEPSAGGGE